MVLAEGASQIAAIAACGKDPAAGMKLPQRLFFDRIQGKTGDPAIVFRMDHTVRTYPRSAEAPVSLRNLTVMKTYIAPCHTVCLRQVCLTTRNRCRVTVSFGPIPAFCRAIATCCCTVSTPSRSGSSRPLRWPRLTITP